MPKRNSPDSRRRLRSGRNVLALLQHGSDLCHSAAGHATSLYARELRAISTPARGDTVPRKPRLDRTGACTTRFASKELPLAHDFPRPDTDASVMIDTLQRQFPQACTTIPD